MARQTIIRLVCDRCAQVNKTVDGEEHRVSVGTLTAAVILCQRCRIRYLDPLTAIVHAALQASATAEAGPDTPIGVRPSEPRVSVPATVNMVECGTCDPPVGMISDKRYAHASRVHPGTRVWDLAWVALPGSGMNACPDPDCHGYPVAGVVGMTSHARRAHPDNPNVLAEFTSRTETLQPTESEPASPQQAPVAHPVVIGPARPLSLPHPAIRP